MEVRPQSPRLLMEEQHQLPPQLLEPPLHLVYTVLVRSLVYLYRDLYMHNGRPIFDFQNHEGILVTLYLISTSLTQLGLRISLFV